MSNSTCFNSNWLWYFHRLLFIFVFECFAMLVSLFIFEPTLSRRCSSMMPFYFLCEHLIFIYFYWSFASENSNRGYLYHNVYHFSHKLAALSLAMMLGAFMFLWWHFSLRNLLIYLYAAAITIRSSQMMERIHSECKGKHQFTNEINIADSIENYVH